MCGSQGVLLCIPCIVHTLCVEFHPLCDSTHVLSIHGYLDIWPGGHDLEIHHVMISDPWNPWDRDLIRSVGLGQLVTNSCKVWLHCMGISLSRPLTGYNLCMQYHTLCLSVIHDTHSVRVWSLGDISPRGYRPTTCHLGMSWFGWSVGIDTHSV